MKKRTFFEIVVLVALVILAVRLDAAFKATPFGQRAVAEAAESERTLQRLYRQLAMRIAGCLEDGNCQPPIKSAPTTLKKGVLNINEAPQLGVPRWYSSGGAYVQ